MKIGGAYTETGEIEDFFPIERQQRLDLILHLLPNTRDVVVVRGPDQSGKSFFIQQLKNQIDSSWMFCPVKVDDLLGEEKPLTVLAKAFDNLDGSIKQPLVRLEAWTKAEKKIIVCIEDAQKLDAARFDFLFQIVDSYECARIILTSSDNLGESIESRCQLIDIEPFSQKQTVEYARKRIHKKSIDFVNAAGIDDVILFIETGGLPGRINDVLEQMNGISTPEKKEPKPDSIITKGWVVGAVLIASIVLFFYPEGNSKPPAATVMETEQRLMENKAIEPIVPNVIKKEIKLQTEITPKIAEVKFIVDEKLKPERNKKKNTSKTEIQKKFEKKKKAVEAQVKNVTVKSKPAVKKAAVLKKEIKKIVVAPVTKKITPIQANQQWVKSRNKRHYTLQLLGVSTEESASKFITKHKVIKNMYFFQNKRNGGKWFNVIYGDFKNKEIAVKEAKKLPSSLAKIKPWIRSFDAVEKDLFVRK